MRSATGYPHGEPGQMVLLGCSAKDQVSQLHSQGWCCRCCHKLQSNDSNHHKLGHHVKQVVQFLQPTSIQPSACLLCGWYRCFPVCQLTWCLLLWLLHLSVTSTQASAWLAGTVLPGVDRPMSL
jgi:hypothetical protein